MGAANSKGGPKITPHDRAVLDLKLQRDKIKQYQRKLQHILDLEHSAARAALARGNKERARTALRRRKYQEQLLVKTEGQLETLEGLVSSIEFSQIQQSVMLGLQQGNSVLKEIHKEMSVESVERLMENTAEAQSYQREIDEMLASRMTAEDEEAVQAELDALSLAQAQAQSDAEPEGPVAAGEGAEIANHLPSVPTIEPVAPDQEQGPERSTAQRAEANRAREPVFA